MKKAIIAASAAIILAARVATCWTMYSGSEDEFFNENLEALMDPEIPQEEKDAGESSLAEICVYQMPGKWVSVEMHRNK